MMASLARIAFLACYRGAEARRTHTITLKQLQYEAAA
jgi:hypothetical protein